MNPVIALCGVAAILFIVAGIIYERQVRMGLSGMCCGLVVVCFLVAVASTV